MHDDALNPAFAATEPPPVMEARRWLVGVTHPANRPLINVKSGRPGGQPAPRLRQALADAALNNPDAHLYGPVLGLPALREEIATQFSAAYGGTIAPDQVAITQGCNQAFTAIMATLAGQGRGHPADALVLQSQDVAGHDRRFSGAAGHRADADPRCQGRRGAGHPAHACDRSLSRRTTPVAWNTRQKPSQPSATLPVRAGLPSSSTRPTATSTAATRWSWAGGHMTCSRTPPGLTRSPALQFFKGLPADRASGGQHRRRSGPAGRGREVPRHRGHLPLAAGPDRCSVGHAEPAALGGWRADEILARRRAMTEGFSALAGWKLLGCGAYFAYVEHPFDIASTRFASGW